MCHFVLHGETLNVQYYAEHLQNHLRRAVRRKWSQLQNVIILHDNALHIRRFVSGICYDAGGGKYWSIHHTCRTFRLVIMIYSLKLKDLLRGHRFYTRDDIATAVRRLIMTNFGHGEADGIRRLPHRWQRTIDSLGDYFEGL